MIHSIKALLQQIHKLFRLIHKKINPVGFARAIGVEVGKECRLIDVDFGSEPYLVRLGHHVSATNTHFVTHDGGVWVFRKEHPEMDIIKPIVIGNNVFLGLGVTVLPGVTIGDNVVIGAGTVVTKSIPSNSVAAGVPARVISELDVYFEKCADQALSCKSLSPAMKRRFLEQQYRR